MSGQSDRVGDRAIYQKEKALSPMFLSGGGCVKTSLSTRMSPDGGISCGISM